MKKHFCRLGDGYPIEMSESEIMADLVEGSEDAADRGKVPPLSEDECQHLFKIFCSPHKFVSVEPGHETILTYDAGTLICHDISSRSSLVKGLNGYAMINHPLPHRVWRDRPNQTRQSNKAMKL